ncbi:MAG: flagellar motor switch protein FliN [Pseudomonadota bacterium]
MSDETGNPQDDAVAEAPVAGEDETFADAAAPDRNLDVIMDIPVRLSMEVGSASVSIRKLLELNRGSVVELDRLAGEPLDVLVNGKLVAQGEVVVVNDKFGVRLNDVVSAKKRIETLH